MTMRIQLGPISKGIAGAVAGAVASNTGMVVMSADQVASMPWWGVLISNVVYAGLGFLTVYFAPANTAPKGA